MVDAHPLRGVEGGRRPHDVTESTRRHEGGGLRGSQCLARASRCGPRPTASTAADRPGPGQPWVPVAAAVCRYRWARRASVTTSSSGGMSASHSKRVETRPVRAVARAYERPHLVQGRPAVGVDDVGALVRVAGQVVLHDPVGGDRVDVLLGAEAVVEGAHVDVVHVQEEAAVGLDRQAGQELPLGDPRGRELQVGRRVLEDQGALEERPAPPARGRPRGAAWPRRRAAGAGRGCCGRRPRSSRGGRTPSGRSSARRAP